MASLHRTQARERAYNNMLKAGIKEPRALQKNKEKSTLRKIVYMASFFNCHWREAEWQKPCKVWR
jgi:hypothetical protein